MPCVEDVKKALMAVGLVAGIGAVAWLTGCATNKPDAPSGTASSNPAAPAKPSPEADKPRSTVGLSAPTRSRNWKEVRLQAARRLVTANPDITYMGKPPDLLRAIPVLTIELSGDGSIRRIEVMRYPSQDRETVDIAIKALRRAAPYGDVSHLPKPWRFNETFLFNNQHKFKPMTLDQL